MIQSEVLKHDIGAAKLSSSEIYATITDFLDQNGVSSDCKAMLDFELFIGIVFEFWRKSSCVNDLCTHEHHSKHLIFPIDPDSKAKQAWDLCLMLLLIYTSFQVPYNLAFSGKDEDLESGIVSTPMQVTKEKER